MKKHKDHSFAVDEILKRCGKESIILEMGCGAGINILKLNSEGYKFVEGFDKDAKKIKEFSHLLKRPSVAYVEGVNGFSSDRKYDVIFHSLAGIFLSPPERKKMTETIYSCLKPEGYYIFEELKKDNGLNPNLNRPPFFYSNQEIEELDKSFLKITEHYARRKVNGKITRGGIVYVGKKLG